MQVSHCRFWSRMVTFYVRKINQAKRVGKAWFHRGPANHYYSDMCGGPLAVEVGIYWESSLQQKPSLHYLI